MNRFRALGGCRAAQGWLRALLPLALLLLFMSAPAAVGQDAGAVFALPGTLAQADSAAAVDAFLVQADGTRAALVGGSEAIAAQMRALAATGAAVTVWGLRLPQPGAQEVMIRVSRIEEVAAPATPPPATPPVLAATRTPRATAGATPVTPPMATPGAGLAGLAGLATRAPTAYPTLISLPAIGQPIATINTFAANVRSGPGDAFAPIATVAQGTQCLVLGRARFPGWYYLQCPGATGWVREGLYALAGPLDALPALVPVTATPDALATPTPRWRVTGFANRNLSGEPAVAFGVDDVNFNWGLEAAYAGLPIDDFSLRLESLLPFASGTYSVALTYDDGARLWVDDVLVIDDWNEGAVRTQAWTGTLTGDESLRIEYFEAYSEARLQLAITPLQVQAAPPTPIPAAARPALPATDTGWLASYYNGPAPAGAAALVQVEALDDPYPLNREYSVESPAPGLVGVDNWSARWRGRFTLEAGDYQFRARGNDGVRVYIDGVRVINAWPNAGDEVGTIVRGLGAGAHEIAVDLFDAGGLAWVRAAWQKAPAP